MRDIYLAVNMFGCPVFLQYQHGDYFSMFTLKTCAYGCAISIRGKNFAEIVR